MAKTISSTYSSAISLTSTASNPVTIKSTGLISVTATSGGALTGTGGNTWTIANAGTIRDTGGQGKGIFLGNFTTNVTSAVVTNQSGGLISASGTLGYGVFFYGPGSVTNLSGGTISAGHIAVEFNSSLGTIINSGVILASSNVAAYEREGGIITNLAGGTISGSTGVWFQYAAGTFTNAGTVMGSSSQDGAVLFNDQTSANLLIVDPGAVFIGAVNGGTGSVELASAASAGTLSGFSGTSITNFGTLKFDTGAQWTIAGNTSASGLGTMAITGFGAGDTIDVTGFAASSYTFASNALTLTSGASHATLHIQGAFTTSNFKIFSDGAGGTDVVCYLAGTRIRTDKGEVPVEQLGIGDKVITLSGEAKPIKWIGRRSYASAFASGNRDVIPILVRQDALGPGVPMRDLYVSPLHALFFDDVLIQAEHLVNGVTILRCPEIDPIRYFHIELEQHDVIFAEGCPAETFVDCDSRGIFHNAREFAQLYPGDSAPSWRFCAPRIESGPILDQIRHVIDARAGLRDAAAASAVGPLHGNLDGVEGTSIVGWAFDPTHPNKPVTLELMDGDGLIARVTANRYRGDLEAAGIGDGRHGFELRLARSLSPMTRHEIRLRRVADGRELPGSPLVIEPHTDRALLKDARIALDTAIGVAGDATALDAVLATLLDRVGTVRRLRSSLQSPPTGDDRLVSWAKSGRSRPKRALIIDDRVPRRDRDAGSNAVLGHIEAMRALGWTVELVASHELARADEAVAAMQAWGVRCHQAPQAYSVEEVLRHNRNSFDLVYLHRLSNAEAYAAMSRQWQPRARLIYSVADLHHLRLARQAAMQGNDEQLEASVRLKARELAAMRLVDAMITHSTEEAAYLAREAPGANVHVVPWAVTPRRRTVALRHRSDIAFIGGYRHAPNADAVRWLSEAVMPLVWQRDPDMGCLIVGPDWPDKLAAAADPRLRFVGQVPRLEEIFDSVRLTVAPLRFGAGLKGKVLDSLAAGLPCVMTPLAAEGLPLCSVLRGLVAETPEALAELICDLHHRSGLNRSRAEAGLAMVAEHYTEDAVRDALARAIEGEVVAAPDSVVEPQVKRLPVMVWSTPRKREMPTLPVVIWSNPTKRAAGRRQSR